MGMCNILNIFVQICTKYNGSMFLEEGAYLLRIYGSCQYLLCNAVGIIY